MKVAVIVPTYNESQNIRSIITNILEVFKQSSIDGGLIVVDDASPDGTARIAKEYNSKSISVLERPSKMGIGNAYKDGFQLALEKGFDGVIEMDADLSHNPMYIPEFVQKLDEGLDLVIGSRYVPGGGIPHWPFYRRFISGFTNRTTKFLLGLSPRDITSGFRAYSSNALEKLDLGSVKSDGYAFQVEMVLKCQKANLKISEIPIIFIDRQQGKSKLDREEMWRFFKSVIRLIFEK